MTKEPYIVSYDSVGSHAVNRWAICWQPFTGSSPIWFTGTSMTSAALKPRIKYFRSEAAAQKGFVKARALAARTLAANYS